MRINVYAEELPDKPDVQLIRKRIRGKVYHAVRIYLHSPVQLHHTAEDDDRSAITFWSYSKAKAIAHAISLLTLDQVH